MGAHPTNSSTDLLPRLCGADIELGNFIVGVERAGGTGYEASRALLAEIEGLPRHNSGYLNCWLAASSAPSRPGYNSQSVNGASTSDYAYDLQDVSRRFLLSNGGCAYIDLDHVELCLPEVIDAFDHVAAWHGMLQITRNALQRANQSRSPNSRIQVLVNNSDGQGNSYGSHLNFMISRRVRQHFPAQVALSSVSGFIPDLEYSSYRARQGWRGEWPALHALSDQPA
jgi:hypothetical protein